MRKQPAHAFVIKECNCIGLRYFVALENNDNLQSLYQCSYRQQEKISGSTNRGSDPEKAVKYET